MMSIKETMIKLKLYFERGRMYLGFLSFSGTAFIVVAQLKQMGVPVDLTNYTAIAIISVIFLTMIIGFLEVRMKFFSKDLEIRGMKNPITLKLLKNQDIILERLKEFEQNKKDN